MKLIIPLFASMVFLVSTMAFSQTYSGGQVGAERDGDGGRAWAEGRPEKVDKPEKVETIEVPERPQGRMQRGK